jgi:chromosome segregation ATPase
MQDILKKTPAGNYTSDSVKKYVKELKNLYDKDFNEMRARMIFLRDENRHIKEELEEYKDKERYISATVLRAEQMAQHIRDEAEFLAKKRINDAEDAERKARQNVDRAMERLHVIQKSLAALLNEVIETTQGLKEEIEPAHDPHLEKAAEVYRFINGITARTVDEPDEARHFAI